jgi:endonuclease/exonuclease/phosphatase family metal-dependent hydrolase
MSTFRIMTYNVLHGGVGRERLIRDVVSAVQPHIAVFTEVTAADSFDAIADAVGPYRASREGRRGREYPVIVSRWPIIDCQLHGPPWAPRKWVEATVRPFGGAPVTVHGIHLVSQPLWPMEMWRRQEVHFLLNRLQRGDRARQIIAGDFNAVAAGDTQSRGGAPWWIRAQWLAQGGTTPRWALKVLTDAGYTDCYRTCRPKEGGFTVPAWNPSVRLDYVFASADLQSALRSSDVLEPPPADEASDHLPMWADFEWPSENGLH